MQFILNCLYIIIDSVLSPFDFSLPPYGLTVISNLIRYAWVANLYVDIPAFIAVAFYCVTIHLVLMVLSALLQIL